MWAPTCAEAEVLAKRAILEGPPVLSMVSAALVLSDGRVDEFSVKLEDGQLTHGATRIVLRAAGIAAYLMLWATVTWGLIGTTSLVGKRVARATATTIHQFLANTALLLLGVHIGGLLLDTYVRGRLIRHPPSFAHHASRRARRDRHHRDVRLLVVLVTVDQETPQHQDLASGAPPRRACLRPRSGARSVRRHRHLARPDVVVRRDRRFRPVPHVDPRLDDRVATPTAGTAGGAVRAASTAGDGGRRRAVSAIRVESVSRERQSRGS